MLFFVAFFLFWTGQQRSLLAQKTSRAQTEEQRIVKVTFELKRMTRVPGRWYKWMACRLHLLDWHVCHVGSLEKDGGMWRCCFVESFWIRDGTKSQFTNRKREIWILLVACSYLGPQNHSLRGRQEERCTTDFLPPSAIKKIWKCQWYDTPHGTTTRECYTYIETAKGQ